MPRSWSNIDAFEAKLLRQGRNAIYLLYKRCNIPGCHGFLLLVKKNPRFYLGTSSVDPFHRFYSSRSSVNSYDQVAESSNQTLVQAPESNNQTLVQAPESSSQTLAQAPESNNQTLAQANNEQILPQETFSVERTPAYYGEGLYDSESDRETYLRNAARLDECTNIAAQTYNEHTRIAQELVSTNEEIRNIHDTYIPGLNSEASEEIEVKRRELDFLHENLAQQDVSNIVNEIEDNNSQGLITTRLTMEEALIIKESNNTNTLGQNHDNLSDRRDNLVTDMIDVFNVAIEDVARVDTYCSLLSNFASQEAIDSSNTASQVLNNHISVSEVIRENSINSQVINNNDTNSQAINTNDSLIDDYADPNLEQPSYMDPED